MSNISRAPVGVPGKADEIITSKSLHLCGFPRRILFVETASPGHTCIRHAWTYHSCVYLFHHRWFYSSRFTHNLSTLQ